MAKKDSSQTSSGKSGSTGKPAPSGKTADKRTLDQRAREFLSDTWRWIVFGALALLLFLLIRPSGASTRDTSVLAEGEIPAETIYAPFTFSVEDEERTQAERERAAESTRPHFNQTTPPSRQAIQERIDALFAVSELVATEDPDATTAEEARGEIADPTATALPGAASETGVSVTPDRSILSAETSRSEKRAALQERVNLDLADTTLEVLLEAWDNPELREAVRGAAIAVAEQLERGVTRNDEGRRMLAQSPEGAVTRLREIRDGKPQTREWILASGAGIVSREDLVRETRKQIDEALPPNNADTLRLNLAAWEIVESFVFPTLEYDRQGTEEARERAAANVIPVKEQFREGEVIVEKGKRVTKRGALALRELSRRKAGDGIYLSGIGWLFLSVLPVIALFGYLRRYEPGHYDNPRLVTVLAFIILFVVAWAKVAYILQGLSTEAPEYFQDIHYATPVAMAGILVTVLANGWLAVFVMMLIAYCVGILVDPRAAIGVITVCLLSGIIGAYAVTRVRRRVALYRAGLWCGLTAVLAVFALNLISHPTPFDLYTNRQSLFFGLTWGVFNALQSCALASFLLLPLESFLGVVTDIKLLEIGVKSDLLRDLEEKAPGTYQHSLNVANLSETAAEAIGANGLLVRVGAYYHDIGKIVKPKYFTENQRTEQDKLRHQKLSPHMSCLIIRNHVKEGLEIARKENLPRVIQDFIAEHHGTTLMSYFYEQAVSSDETDSISEEDFRYAGPKPQSIESAIMMIADSIEATFRSMGPLTEGEVTQLVRKIINDKFIDGQFEECPLTLRDLHRLSAAFTRAISNMRHQRIEYPASSRPLPEVDILRVGKGQSRPAVVGPESRQASSS